MPEHELSVDLQAYGALGGLEGSGELIGTIEFVLDALRERLEHLGPGDTLLVRAHHEVPADHPLHGIELPATFREGDE